MVVEKSNNHMYGLHEWFKLFQIKYLYFLIFLKLIDKNLSINIKDQKWIIIH